MNAVISRIDQARRISISAQQRRVLGLEGGSPIVISVVGNELRIRSINAAMAELQNEAGQFLQGDTASVDAFIAQRRSDWDGEDEPVSAPSDPNSDDFGYTLAEPEPEKLVSVIAGLEAEEVGAAPAEPEPKGKPAPRRVPVSRR